MAENPKIKQLTEQIMEELGCDFIGVYCGVRDSTSHDMIYIGGLPYSRAENGVKSMGTHLRNIIKEKQND